MYTVLVQSFEGCKFHYFCEQPSNICLEDPLLTHDYYYNWSSKVKSQN